uniref:Ion transport domain-containing protein n=2 Tax=Cyclophora tenuis TaxID=216820 RepID=A0A7S1DBF1_CYCTE
MLIDFAVFAGGVFNVFRRLVAFLMVLGIILIGFAQMFVTVFRGNSYCPSLNETLAAQTDTFNGTLTYLNNIRCGEDENTPYCNYWESFLDVYTMLLGEVDETKFETSKFGTFLFVIFMFLVVILLANVLIAIVTDSYRIIQDKRAAIVFWTNRLDFVAEMDAIANGPWKKRLKRAVGMGDDDSDETGHVDVVFGKEFWKRLMDLFEDDIDDSFMSVEFWAYNFLRMLTAVIIIPFWVFLGVLSAGWLWPPQLREAIFTSTVSKHSSESEKEDEQRRTQVVSLQKEVEELKDEMMKELKVDRTQVVQMKSSVAERRVEIANEMKHIKRIMTMLFEQSALDT